MVTHFTICFEGRIVWGPETKQMRALFFKADKECDFLDHFSPLAKVVHKAGCCFSPLGRKFCCDSNSDAVPPRSSSAAVSSTLELDRSCCHAYHTQLKSVLVVARKSTRQITQNDTYGLNVSLIVLIQDSWGIYSREHEDFHFL